MNNRNWTPGPWAVDWETRAAEVCTIHSVPEAESNGQRFLYVRGELGYWAASDDENMANAHLIAAAPDMADLLVEAVELQEKHYGDGTSLHLSMIEWAKRGREAIKKLRGEQ